MSSAHESESLPFHLRGNYAPVNEEVTVFDLAVEGSLPPELRGLYLRNGPNPREPTPHWFLGDGMVHGVRLEDGRARWYRNRWVRTRTFTEGASFLGEDGSVDRSTGVANTNVVAHAGRILALVETSFPIEIGPELDTRGPHDFGGRLATAMTAHPRFCPRTGEMHFFGYGFAPPWLTYHRADAQGRLVESLEIPVPGPTMMHDFVITDRHVVFMDLPVVFSPELVAEGRFPYRWSDDYGARLGLLPRGAGVEALRWLEVEPCYVFHPFNAYEDGGRVVVDVCRYPELWRDQAEHFVPASPHRWILDPQRGRVTEQALGDEAVEFPRIDDRRTGLAHRYGYAVGQPADAGVEGSPQSLLKLDFASGAREVHDFGEGRHPGEGVFVPGGAGPGEDDGYVLTFVYDAARDASELHVLDASHFGAPPVARVSLPRRVPFGFHGNWIPDAR